MNTRNRKAGEPMAQEAFASSVEHERGLLCNLVANRAECCRSPRERAVLWFLQAMSWQPGGLDTFAKDLVTAFPDHPMHVWDPGETDGVDSLLDDEGPPVERIAPQMRTTTLEKGWSAPSLARHLDRWCLDPSETLGRFGNQWSPDEVPGLLELLEEMERRNRRHELSSVAPTTVCAKVFEALDFTVETGCLTLIEGQSRTGKTASGETWCRANPSRARFVKVPSTGDDIGFFRRIAEVLGGSSALSLKGVQLRERVEKTLQSARLMLVFDEAHSLWPQANRREALPSRINWIRTALIDHGVPVALLTTPQFLNDQRLVELKTKWNSQQWVGRIGHYEQLPAKLTEGDLEAIARSKLPDGSAKSVELLWRYALESTQYAAAIEHVLKRATFEAKLLGRDRPGFDDIKKVIRAAVLPSDVLLKEALSGRRSNSQKVKPAAVLEPTVRRETTLLTYEPQ